MKRKLHKQNGFTLVELLVSITILMMVLTVFFTFFSNSASYTQKNNEDLQTMNLAKDILEKIKEPKPLQENNSKSSPYVIQLMDGKNIKQKLTLSSSKSPSLSKKDNAIVDNLMKDLGLKKDWRFDATLTNYQNDTYINNAQLKLTLIPTAISTNKKQRYELVMVTVSIYDKNADNTSTSPISETYGYVAVGGNER
jgi:prepilin-type N-terminal cleavage/methylation domain-containing protein